MDSTCGDEVAIKVLGNRGREWMSPYLADWNKIAHVRWSDGAYTTIGY